MHLEEFCMQLKESNHKEAVGENWETSKYSHHSSTTSWKSSINLLLPSPIPDVDWALICKSYWKQHLSSVIKCIAVTIIVLTHEGCNTWDPLSSLQNVHLSQMGLAPPNGAETTCSCRQRQYVGDNCKKCCPQCFLFVPSNVGFNLARTMLHEDIFLNNAVATGQRKFSNANWAINLHLWKCGTHC